MFSGVHRKRQGDARRSVVVVMAVRHSGERMGQTDGQEEGEGPIMPRGRPKKGAANATTAPPAKLSKANGNGANLGFEAQMFLAADKLRKNLEPSDYKHVALGLIFLKYISIAFEAKRAALLVEDPAAAEDPDEYLAE